MKKERYADDYIVVVTRDKKGREKKTAQYKGKYFRFALDDDSVKNFKSNAIIASAAAAFFHIAGGFMNNAGMYQFYVAIPYVAVFFPLLYQFYGVLRLPNTNGKFTRDCIGLSFDRAKRANLGVLIVSGMCALGELSFLVFTLFSNVETTVGEFAFFGFELLTTAAAYFFLVRQSKVKIEEIGDI